MTKNMLLPARLLLLCAVWLAVHAQSTTQLGGDGQSVVVHNQQQILDKIREMDSKMEGMDSTLKELGADVSTKHDINDIGAKVDKLQQDLSTLECSSDGGGNEEVAKSIEDLKDDHVNIKTQLSDLRSKMQTLSTGVPALSSCNSTGGQTVPCKVEGECERLWKQRGVNCYYRYPFDASRESAIRWCRERKSELVKFDDREELNAVVKMYGIGYGHWTWVQAQRVENKFFWDNCVTEGLSSRCTYEEINPDLWDAGQPSYDGKKIYVAFHNNGMHTTETYARKFVCKYTLQ